MSKSIVKLPVLNENCALRRNVRVQPYGRCSICTLELRQCHAWQSSAMSFAMVVLLLIAVAAPAGWAQESAIGAVLVLLVAQGISQHRRTDQLILGQHQLALASGKLRDQNRVIEAAREGLEHEVLGRTEKLRAANVELARANLELADAARRRDALVLDVSHDLRTPLTSVKGAAQNLLDGIAGPLGDSQREYVEIVREHAERLIVAVGQLLDGTRAASAPIEVLSGPVELAGLVRDVARSLSPIAEERGVSMDVRADAVATVADGAKLRQVLENLVGNALKFTDTGGRVSLDVAEDAGLARVTVRDTGTGIDPVELPHIFDRFYRAEEGRPGSGLGLAITRDLVRLHGGEITVQSALGVGSEFSVSLPVRSA